MRASTARWTRVLSLSADKRLRLSYAPAHVLDADQGSDNRCISLYNLIAMSGPSSRMVAFSEFVCIICDLVLSALK